MSVRSFLFQKRGFTLPAERYIIIVSFLLLVLGLKWKHNAHAMNTHLRSNTLFHMSLKWSQCWCQSVQFPYTCKCDVKSQGYNTSQTEQKLKIPKRFVARLIKVEELIKSCRLK